MKTLIIIPTYNEKDNILQLAKEIFEFVPSVNILVVDDGSPDGTGNLVSQFSKSESRMHLLQRSGKSGLGSAYRAGMRWALEKGYEFVVEMDADFSHPPRFLPEMLRSGAENDFVIASRYVHGGGAVNWHWMRKLISRGGSFYARMILGHGIRDYTGGFNGWRSHVLKGIELDKVHSEGYSFQIEMKFRAAEKGFKFVEFPLVFEERREGQSKMSSKIIREAMWRVLQFRLSLNP